MEVTQNFMDEMKSMMKVLMDRSQTQGAQIDGLIKAMGEVKEEINEIKGEITVIKEEIADIRDTMATKDDIKIIHEQLAEIKSDQAYLKNQSYKHSLDIYHLKLQTSKMNNEE